jgi:hypothetical protein
MIRCMSCAAVSSARASPDPNMSAHVVKDVFRVHVITREDDCTADQFRRGKTSGTRGVGGGSYTPSSKPSFSSPSRSFVCSPCPESADKSGASLSHPNARLHTVKEQAVVRSRVPDEPVHRTEHVLPRRAHERVGHVVCQQDDVANVEVLVLCADALSMRLRRQATRHDPPERNFRTFRASFTHPRSAFGVPA